MRRFEKPLTVVNLDRIQLLIDSGRIDANQLITLKTLRDCGIRPIKHGVLIAERGAAALESSCKIVATQFTQRAIERIEETGGKAVAMHITKLGLRSMFVPHRIVGTADKPTGKRLPRFASPVKERDRLYYFSKRNRGYLHPEMQQMIQSDEQLKEFFKRAVIIPPREGIFEKIAELEEQKMEETHGFNY